MYTKVKKCLLPSNAIDIKVKKLHVAGANIYLLKEQHYSTVMIPTSQ